jgi:hypothetical protein
VAFPLHSEERYLRSAKDIRDLFADGEKRLNIDQALRTSLYLLGLTHYRHDRVGEITEYKESFREPGKYKCYKVIRFSIQTDSTPDLVNLTDPLALSRFLFLPIPRGAENPFVTLVTQPEHGITREFRNVPLASNLCRTLEDENAVERLRERAVVVSNQSLFQRYKGYLVKCDIAGSGRLSQWLLRDATPFVMTNADLEFGHEMNMHAFFLRALATTGFPHVYPMGDGFLAGRPFEPAAPSSTFGVDLHRLCGLLSDYCSRITRATRHAADVDFRLAVVASEYAFGRFHLLNSSCYFMTPDAIKVTRMEDGLKTARKAGRVSSDSRVIMDLPTVETASSDLEGRFHRTKSRVAIEAKEARVVCSTYRVL